ncbi:MAG: arsenite methyltransferase [Bacteroidia bacterium]|nr:arsenite methyltransferase [Bacteroidia bacterium]
MENNENKIREMVREKYSEIANQSRTENATSCCGTSGCCTVDYEVFAENYSELNGYVSDADLGLGCGIPTEFALIKKGDTVIDLGSGAGNDCFVARALTGENGKVIGIDMTEAMIDKARENAEKLGFNNVEFRLGIIEKIPVTASRADVVVSNCVLNLVPDKRKAFTEMFRVLKPGGHFSVSDVVVRGGLPENLKQDAELYAGCVSGAIEYTDYVDQLREAGFINVEVKKEKQIQLPKEITDKYNVAQNESYGIFSITVYGEKPKACCPPGCC